MPANKNVLIRYKTIDRCLRNRYKRWTLDDLVDACSDALYDMDGITKGFGDMSLYLYREAYDILCNCQPTDISTLKAPTIKVKMPTPDDDTDTEENFDAMYPYLQATNCESNSCEDNAAKEVVIDNNVTCLPQHIAAMLIWHSTWYGFTPKTWKNVTEEWWPDYGQYSERIYNIEVKKVTNYLSKKSKKELLGHERNNPRWHKRGVAYSPELLKEYSEHHEHRNRAKRMRDHRMEMLTRKLMRRARCETLYNDLSQNGTLSMVDRDYFDKQYIFYQYEIETQTFGKSDRIEYLRVLANYLEDTFNDMNKFIVVCSYSATQPHIHSQPMNRK